MRSSHIKGFLRRYRRCDHHASTNLEQVCPVKAMQCNSWQDAIRAPPVASLRLQPTTTLQLCAPLRQAQAARHPAHELHLRPAYVVRLCFPLAVFGTGPIGVRYPVDRLTFWTVA